MLPCWCAVDRAARDPRRASPWHGVACTSPDVRDRDAWSGRRADAVDRRRHGRRRDGARRRALGADARRRDGRPLLARRSTAIGPLRRSARRDVRDDRATVRAASSATRRGRAAAAARRRSTGATRSSTSCTSAGSPARSPVRSSGSPYLRRPRRRRDRADADASVRHRPTTTGATCRSCGARCTGRTPTGPTRAGELAALVAAAHERGIARVARRRVQPHRRGRRVDADVDACAASTTRTRTATDADGSYTDDSGCGNDIDPSRRRDPRASCSRRCERFADLGVDGFRFDLASLLTRDGGDARAARSATGRSDARRERWSPSRGTSPRTRSATAFPDDALAAVERPVPRRRPRLPARRARSGAGAGAADRRAAPTCSAASRGAASTSSPRTTG